ncbi:Arsenical pump-driving ATPase [Myxococcaceae bacterium]|nr:Arsenical pump-driving ATPase [Myxococcaceae bacterium]
MRVVLYTGKGGVGKTTTAAATAACAGARGVRTLIVSADAAHSLGDVLERRLGPRPTPVAPGLDALEADSREEMTRHWGRVRDWLMELFCYQGIDAVVAEELALLPGAEEIATLLAVEEHGRSGGYDLVVVDCAPTDATLRLLTLPEMARGALRFVLRLQEAASAVMSPLARAIVSAPLPEAGVFRDLEKLLYVRLRRLRALVRSARTTVRLVVTPERMVIDEARRAFTDLSLFDVACDAVVMNRLLPDEARREAFFRDWARVEEERCKEVAEAFSPLPILAAPLRDDEVLGIEALRAHGEALFERAEPDSVLGCRARVRFASDANGWRVELPLPNATNGSLDVAKLDAELIVRAGARRRAIGLPRRIAALHLESARLDGDLLVVRFAGSAAERPPCG